MRELLMDMICRADEKQLRAIYVFVKKVMRVFWANKERAEALFCFAENQRKSDNINDYCKYKCDYRRLLVQPFQTRYDIILT